MGNLDKFLFTQSDLESPTHFLKWNFYFGVTSCLGRKVWIGDIDHYPVFPNLYLIFVGPPATGKSLPANKVRSLLKQVADYVKQGDREVLTRLVKVLPDSVTLEALVEAMDKSTKIIEIEGRKGKRRKYAHSSGTFALSEELGVLFRQNTNDLVMFLTAGYNCGDYVRETKTKGGNNVRNMCLNFLGCAVPEWIAKNVDDKLIDLGFTSRVIFVYGDKPRKRTPLLSLTDEQFFALEEIRDHFKDLAKLAGQVKLSAQETPEAWEWFEDWVVNRQDTDIVNTDRRLTNYYARKKIHLLKMAMAVHFADKTTMELELEDFQKADKLLKDTEMTMHLALASMARNPTYDLAKAILDKIKADGKLKNKDILLTFFDQGSEEDIQRAIKWLVDTDKITEALEEGKRVYLKK